MIELVECSNNLLKQATVFLSFGLKLFNLLKKSRSSTPFKIPFNSTRRSGLRNPSSSIILQSTSGFECFRRHNPSLSLCTKTVIGRLHPAHRVFYLSGRVNCCIRPPSFFRKKLAVVSHCDGVQPKLNRCVRFVIT